MTDPQHDLGLPASSQSRDPVLMRKLGYVMWQDAINSAYPVLPVERSASDLAVVPYSSGTKGNPKGCMHSHYTVNVTAIDGVVWRYQITRWRSIATMAIDFVNDPHVKSYDLYPKISWRWRSCDARCNCQKTKRFTRA